MFFFVFQSFSNLLKLRQFQCVQISIGISLRQETSYKFVI